MARTRKEVEEKISELELIYHDDNQNDFSRAILIAKLEVLYWILEIKYRGVVGWEIQESLKF